MKGEDDGKVVDRICGWCLRWPAECGLSHCPGVEEAAEDDAAVTPLEKAAVIDKHFLSALAKLDRWLTEDEFARELHDIARARHILGHYEYGDTNLFEWTDGKVQAAILEELADAVVYQAWLLERAENR